MARSRYFYEVSSSWFLVSKWLVINRARAPHSTGHPFLFCFFFFFFFYFPNENKQNDDLNKTNNRKTSVGSFREGNTKTNFSFFPIVKKCFESFSCSIGRQQPKRHHHYRFPPLLLYKNFVSFLTANLPSANGVQQMQGMERYQLVRSFVFDFLFLFHVSCCWNTKVVVARHQL